MKANELSGQPLAMRIAMTIDRIPSKSTHPQPLRGLTWNASITADTPWASTKAPIMSASPATPATGRTSRKIPSNSVRTPSRIFRRKPSLPRSWIA